MSAPGTLGRAWSPSDDPTPELRPHVRRGLITVAIWLLLMGGWVGFAPISGGVVAQGQVKVDANRRTVTHRDGGTVARIAVVEGQHVRRGDLLLELDDVRVDASVDQLRAALASDKLRLSRLEAEAAQARSWRAPAALSQEFADVNRFSQLAAKEVENFDARRTNLQTQLSAQSQQASDTRTEIDIRQRERANSLRALELMREELKANKTLEAQNFVNRAKVLTLERGVSEYESRHLSNEAELAQARQRLSGIDARARSLTDSYVQSASEGVREVSSQIAENEQRLRASADVQDRQKVVAPVDGLLVNLRVNTTGSAVGPREPIVDIVPADAPLFIEVRLPVEIGPEVHQGMDAEIRLLTGRQRFEQLLPGKVTRVSADALTDERNGTAYFSAMLQVPPEAIRGAAEHLRPGMAAEVYIRVTERTALGFLVEPVAGFFRRGFREH